MEDTDFKTIKITLEGRDLDLDLARRLAEDIASSVISDPMLISWFDGKKGEEHPDIRECQHQPGWIAYAEGHGGCLRIDINGDEYGFIYADAGAAGN